MRQIHYTNDICFSDNWPGNLAVSEGFVVVSLTNVIFELLSCISKEGLNSTVFFKIVLRLVNSADFCSGSIIFTVFTACIGALG